MNGNLTITPSVVNPLPFSKEADKTDVELHRFYELAENGTSGDIYRLAIFLAENYPIRHEFNDHDRSILGGMVVRKYSPAEHPHGIVQAYLQYISDAYPQAEIKLEELKLYAAAKSEKAADLFQLAVFLLDHDIPRYTLNADEVRMFGRYECNNKPALEPVALLYLKFLAKFPHNYLPAQEKLVQMT